jgi:hypothetical protein
MEARQTAVELYVPPLKVRERHCLRGSLSAMGP